jgi:hypothetical protein
LICLFALCADTSSAATKQYGPDDFFADVGSFFKKAFGGHDTPAVDAIKPLLQAPKDGRRLDPTKFYLVKVRCSVRADTATLISEGLAIKEETFAAQTLWLSSSVSDGNVPTNPAKLISVFSFQKAANGEITDFQNDTCSDTFFLAGKDSKLTVSFSLTDTKSLAGFAQTVYTGAKVAVGVVPLILAGPLGAIVANAAKAAAATQDPIKDVIAAFNASPRKAAVAVNLVSSKLPTIVTTAYSRISVTTTQIDNVSDVISANNDLRASFYATFDTISSSLLSGITAPVAKDKCAGFANTLVRSYSFNRKDSSFLIGYFAQSGFPGDIEARLSCIGNKFNAEDIVKYKFVYNVSSGGLREITQADITNFFNGLGFAPTPLNSTVAYNYLARLVGYLSSLAQTPQPGTRDMLLHWIGSDPVRLDDTTGKLGFTNGQLPPGDLADKLSSSEFKRFGCFILKPTAGSGGYDALLLALPLKGGNTDGTFALDQIIGLKLILLGTGNADFYATLKTIQTTNRVPEIVEAVTKNQGECEGGARIAIPKAQG